MKITPHPPESNERSSHLSRWQLPLHSVLLARVSPAVEAVYEEACRHPDCEPSPGVQRQFGGEEDVDEDANSW